jgi:hypothetical protein
MKADIINWATPQCATENTRISENMLHQSSLAVILKSQLSRKQPVPRAVLSLLSKIHK